MYLNYSHSIGKYSMIYHDESVDMAGPSSTVIPYPHRFLGPGCTGCPGPSSPSSFPRSPWMEAVFKNVDTHTHMIPYDTICIWYRRNRSVYYVYIIIHIYIYIHIHKFCGKVSGKLWCSRTFGFQTREIR